VYICEIAYAVQFFWIALVEILQVFGTWQLALSTLLSMLHFLSGFVII